MKKTYTLTHFTQVQISGIRYDIPKQLSQGGFMLMLGGESSVLIDGSQYDLRAGDLIVSFPYSVIQMLEISERFEALAIGVESELLAQAEIPDKGNYFVEIKAHPSISLTRDECDKILSLKQMLEENDADRTLPFKEMIDESILNLILYEVARIYSRRKPNSEHKRSRDEIIFHEFIFQCFQDFKLHRQLPYYAAKQQITPSHLSRSVKRASGRGAQEWLTECVVNNIKVSLKNPQLSIATIAEEHNFPNSSFFSQYFKRYAGLTPRDYRRGL